MDAPISGPLKSMHDDAEQYGDAGKARRAMIMGANRSDSVANDPEMALEHFEDKGDKDKTETSTKIIAHPPHSFPDHHYQDTPGYHGCTVDFFAITVFCSWMPEVAARAQRQVGDLSQVAPRGVTATCPRV
jgi:hypothetical protein